jgi:hypothetical protein
MAFDVDIERISISDTSDLEQSDQRVADRLRAGEEQWQRDLDQAEDWLAEMARKDRWLIGVRFSAHAIRVVLIVGPALLVAHFLHLF